MEMEIKFEHVACRREGPDLKPAIGLDDLNLTIQAGQFVAVMGPPGSGKTTLLQHLNGLLLPDAGAVTVLDYRLERAKPADGERSGQDRGWLQGRQDDGKRREGRGWLPGRRDGGKRGEGRGWLRWRRSGSKFVVPRGLRKRVGLVFQFPEQQLFEDTVERDLRFGPLNFGFGEAEAAEAARRSADRLGLGEELLARSPFELSGGQMRKAAIAAVLAADPELLALDEPTSSLDQASREELMRLLHQWCRERGKTVILVTHRLEEVLPYADEYIVMDAGKCVFQGNAAALLERSEVLERAGAVVPASVQLLADAAAGFGVAPPVPYLSPDQAAAWIVRMLDDGALRSPASRN